jgi:hypothetical protein
LSEATSDEDKDHKANETTNIAISSSDNEVRIEFDYTVKWVAFDADGAMIFARNLMEAAKCAKGARNLH